MPQTRVILYREADGTVPLLEWLDSLSEKVRGQAIIRKRAFERNPVPHTHAMEL